MKKLHVVRFRTNDTEFTIGAEGAHRDNFHIDFDGNAAIWAGISGPLGKDQYNTNYDAGKILSTKMFIRLSDPGEVYSGTAAEINDITLYTCYDPDNIKKFASIPDFLRVVHTRRHIWKDLRREYVVNLYPKWPRFMSKGSSFNSNWDSTLPAFNPWFDLATIGGDATTRPAACSNSMQFAVVAAQGVKFKIRFEHVIGYKGVRNGQAYEP